MSFTLQVLNSRHTFLHRQALLLLASSAALTQEEGERLDLHGLRGSALGKEGVDCNPPLPSWLLKWTALTLSYITEERKALPKVCGAQNE